MKTLKFKEIKIITEDSVEQDRAIWEDICDLEEDCVRGYLESGCVMMYVTEEESNDPKSLELLQGSPGNLYRSKDGDLYKTTSVARARNDPSSRWFFAKKKKENAQKRFLEGY